MHKMQTEKILHTLFEQMVRGTPSAAVSLCLTRFILCWLVLLQRLHVSILVDEILILTMFFWLCLAKVS
jgi:hypothetical protein